MCGCVCVCVCVAEPPVRALKQGAHVRTHPVVTSLGPAVDLTSVDTQSQERELETYKRVKTLEAAYRASAMYQQTLASIDGARGRDTRPPIPFKARDAPGALSRLCVLLR